MGKSYYLLTILLLAFLLVGCNSEDAIDNETSDNINETTDVIEEELGDMQDDELKDTKTDTQLENEPSDAQQNETNSGEAGDTNNPETEGDGVYDQGNNNDQNTPVDEETDSAADNR